MYGGLLQLIRLVSVLGQAHEQHGKRGIRDDRRTGRVLRREQKPTERQRDRRQARNSGHGDEQIQPYALIEQRLCRGFAALTPAAQHSRIHAAHNTDRDHREQTARDRVVIRVVCVQNVAVKPDNEIFVDLVEQRHRDGNAHQRYAVFEEPVQQRLGEILQPHNNRQAERKHRTDGSYTVRNGIGKDSRERRRIIRLAADKRECNRELEHRRGQRPQDGCFDAAELNQRRIEHLKRRVGAEHQRTAQINRALRHSCRNAAADGNEHAQSHIDGRNRGEQAASFIGAVLLTDIAGGGIRHPARKDEVQQLYRGVGQVECTDRTLHKDVGIQRGTPDDEQSLDHLGRQEQHRIARHGIFRGQKKNPRFPSNR